MVHTADTRIEAPNWHPDGTRLLVNGGGRLFWLHLDAPERLHPLDTGDCTSCNNDHGISPDGRTVALSHHLEGGSCIFTVPAAGGSPRRVTGRLPSYWHGWSPDGGTLVYTAKRGDTFDIFTIPLEGGEETRVTATDGHCDGPDYTPDGRWIWFNGDHPGDGADLFRVHPDGTGLERMTEDAFVNWFPHPSPDGSEVLYLAYPEGTTGHPEDLPVELRLMPAGGGAPRTVAAFRGGQGSINVPCWAPDGSAFAYCRYPEG